MHIRYRTFSSIWNNFFDFFSFVKKNIVLLKSDSLGWCIHTLHIHASMPQHTPSLFVGSLLQTKEVRVGKEARHNKGVYLTLCLRQLGISQIQSHYSLELSNGRCPGCDFFIPVRFTANHHCTLLGMVYVCVYESHSMDFHIGVGSDVVCSTLIGSGRASVRGTDNR